MEVTNLRFVDADRMRVAGLEGYYTREQVREVPEQWQRFNAVLDDVPGRADAWTYGVVYPIEVMRYLTAIALEIDAALPEGWVEAEVPARRYAVLAEKGGVEGIRKAWPAIFSQLAKLGMKVAGSPMLERYDDGWMKTGAFEIWIPV